jgi:hypothetical protein
MPLGLSTFLWASFLGYQPLTRAAATNNDFAASAFQRKDNRVLANITSMFVRIIVGTLDVLGSSEISLVLFECCKYLDH